MNVKLHIRTSAAIDAPAEPPMATGLGALWNQGLNRFRCSGMVNSKPYSRWLCPMELPWIVLVRALLTSKLKVWGEPGMARFRAALHAASTVGLTNDPTSALSAT